MDKTPDYRHVSHRAPWRRYTGVVYPNVSVLKYDFIGPIYQACSATRISEAVHVHVHVWDFLIVALPECERRCNFLSACYPHWRPPSRLCFITTDSVYDAILDPAYSWTPCTKKYTGVWYRGMIVFTIVHVFVIVRDSLVFLLAHTVSFCCCQFFFIWIFLAVYK